MRLWVAPHGLHVEPAIADDAARLADIHAQSFYRGWSDDEIADYINKPALYPVYVACDKDRTIAGFMILKVVADDAELLTIAVAKRWRNKGLGDALIRAGFADLIKSPAKSIFLEVEESNAPAVHLYRRLGFKSVNRRDAYYDRGTGDKAAALVMRCDL